MTLGQAIKYHREAQVMTRSELCKKAYIGKTTEWKYEQDITEPTISVLSAICKALGISLLEFIKEVDLCK